MKNFVLSSNIFFQILQSVAINNVIWQIFVRLSAHYDRKEKGWGIGIREVRAIADINYQIVSFFIVTTIFPGYYSF